MKWLQDIKFNRYRSVQILFADTGEFIFADTGEFIFAITGEFIFVITLNSKFEVEKIEACLLCFEYLDFNHGCQFIL